MQGRHRPSAVAQFALSLLLLCGLTLAASGQAGDIDALVASLPRGFVGDFQWDDDRVIQNVAIRFKSVRRLDAEHAEALGCGNYNAAGIVTAIDVRMQVTLTDLRVEIWESAPDQASFTTDGSHRGRLSRGAAGRVGVEPVGRITSLDADHSVVDGRLDKRHIEDVLDRLLGRVGRQGSDGDRVPIGDDGGIAGRRRRRGRRRGGGTCGEGDQERHGRAEREPRAGVRVPALEKWEMDAWVHLAPPGLGRVIVVEGDDSKTTIFLH